MHRPDPHHGVQEVVPITIAGRRGGPPNVVVADEALSKLDASKLRRLPPAFRPDGGTITAGTASPLSDGAAALVLVSSSFARRRGLQVLSALLRVPGRPSHCTGSFAQHRATGPGTVFALR